MTSRYVESIFRAVTSSAHKLDLHSVLSNLTSATTAASAAPLDHLYARIGALNGPFFPAGWGNLSVVNYEEDLRHLIQGPPSSIKLSWRLIERGSRDGTDYLLYEGTFRTPCLQRVFDALPPESRTGRVQLLMPARLQPFQPGSETPTSSEGFAAAKADTGAAASRLPYPHGESRRLEDGSAAACTATAAADGPACVVHLAATGDQTFGRRLRLGFPLLKDNVCSMVLESPFYGARRPAAQRGSKLLRVSDLLTLGWATIAEGINLLHWLREEGYGPLGMCGLSMGGVHACMTAGLYPGDVAVSPLLAPRSAAVAYCDGAMRAVMAWEPLLKEVDENNNHITQVVMAAGRAVTVQVQVPAAVGAGAGAGAGTETVGPTAVHSVALIREATYALADLELRGENRHLAEAEAAANEAADAVVRSTRAVLCTTVSGSSPGGAAVGVGVGAGGAGGTSGEGGGGGMVGPGDGGGGGGGAGGVSAVLKGLPFISVMDLYGSLAGAALRAGFGGLRVGGSSSGGGGGGGGGGSPGHSAAQGFRSHQGEQGAGSVGGLGRPTAGDVPSPAGGSARRSLDAGGGSTAATSDRAASAAAVEEGGPFSGIFSMAPKGPIGAPGGGSGGGGAGPASTAPAAAGGSLDASSDRQHGESPHRRTEGAVPPLSDPWVPRPHPQPHAPDMPFAPQRPSTASGAASTGAGAPAATGGAGDVAAGGGGGGGSLLGRRLLGDLGRAMKQLRADDRRMDNPATVMRLKSVLETYTDVTRYPRPRRTDAAVIVAARDDAYVSTESVRQLHRYWPGSELRMVSGGHVSAFLMHQEAFRGAIRDSLARVARQPPPQR